MNPDPQFSFELAARAAVTAILACQVTGGSKRAAFEAALEAWCDFRPEDGEFEVYERVIPLVLALDGAPDGRLQ